MISSKDGLLFSGQTERVDSSGTEPEIVVLGDALTVFYRKGTALMQARRVGSAWQTSPVRLTDLTPGQVSAPSIVSSPYASRMYFMFTPDPKIGPGGRPPEVRSALLQPDGSWKVDPGIRLLLRGIGDPEVVEIPGQGWRMYYTSADGKIASTSSTDGLNFTADDGTRASEGSSPSVVALSTQRMRMFASVSTASGNVVQASESKDGLNFLLLPRFQVTPTMSVPASLYPPSQVSVTRDQLGIWWMAYVASDTATGQSSS